MNWGAAGLTAASPITALAIDPLTPTTVYAGTDTGVFDIEQVPTAVTASPSPTRTPVPSLTQTATTCVGDCDVNGKVSIDELIGLVNIVLGNPESCAGGLTAGAQADVSLLVVAVNHALNGCGGPPRRRQRTQRHPAAWSPWRPLCHAAEDGIAHARPLGRDDTESVGQPHGGGNDEPIGRGHIARV